MSDFQRARFYVEVLHRPEDGAMMSSHGPLCQEDADLADTWMSGGLVQLSNALLVEYVRKESYVMALTLLSQGKEPSDLTPVDLEQRVRTQMLRMMDQVGMGAAQEAIGRIK